MTLEGIKTALDLDHHETRRMPTVTERLGIKKNVEKSSTNQ